MLSTDNRRGLLRTLRHFHRNWSDCAHFDFRPPGLKRTLVGLVLGPVCGLQASWDDISSYLPQNRPPPRKHRLDDGYDRPISSIHSRVPVASLILVGQRWQYNCGGTCRLQAEFAGWLMDAPSIHLLCNMISFPGAVSTQGYSQWCSDRVVISIAAICCRG